MERKRTLVTVLVLTLMVAPAASASWSVAGNFEPSTLYDNADWMWQEAPGAITTRVYFNVITQGSIPRVGGSYNPNVAAIETRNEAATAEYHEALLGEWADCNGDGYVGIAETAMREYPSELLPAGSPCLRATGSTNLWTYSAGHNYNGLVSELIPISRDAGVRDTRRVEDESAKVWGDFDKPDGAQHTQRCPMHPLPRGTTKDTGGLLAYIDCHVPAVGDAGVRDGPLADLTLFGSDDERHAAAHVVDCDADPLLRVGDVLNATPLGPATLDADGTSSVHDTEVRPPTTSPQGNPEPTSWTVPGQLNATNEELQGDCDTSNDAGQDFYGNWESDNPTIDPKDKRGANWNFYFTTANRGGFPVSLVKGGNAGMFEGDAGQGWGGSRWIADSLWGSKPGPHVLKTTLDPDAGGPEAGFADAYYLTFFAYVGANVTSKGMQLPGGGATAKYGQAQCGAFTSGLHHGWNCDSSTWYKNPDGTEQVGFAELSRDEFAYLGQPYNLRDVDCYDGSNGLGIPAGAGALGEDPCE